MAKTIQTKRCSYCKQIKSLDEFHKDKYKKNGLRTICKFCAKTHQKEYAKTKKGKEVHQRAIMRYRETEKCKETRKQYQESAVGKKVQKRYWQTRKGKVNKKRYCKNNREKQRARDAVKYAIKKCKLPHPNTLLCHYCPKPAQQYHHWHGYEPEHWLDVVPACIKCHKKVHQIGLSRL